MTQPAHCEAANLLLPLTRAHAMMASVIAVTLASSIIAQPAPYPRFEVASIKQSKEPGTPGMTVRYGRINVHNMTLGNVLEAAWDIPQARILGGPHWLDTDQYDFSANAPAEVSTTSFDWWKPMLQTLLADRFHVSLRREVREVPVYNLVAAKGGIKIARSKPGDCIVSDPQKPPAVNPGDTPPRLCNNLLRTRGQIDAVGIDIRRLVNTLMNALGRPVIDKTNFAGTFDLHLEYAPEILSGNADAPSIFSALQDQLGLRLEPAKGPAEVLVIDHVARPSEN